MAKADHIVLCGGASTRSKSREDQTLRLNLSGSDQNVDLEIVDISRRLLTDVPDIFADLVEIASYVYCADQAITRGGEGVQAAGANWRRNFVFHIPVRLPDLWASKEISEALRKTLSILSDDNYLFHFGQRTGERGMQSYLKFGEGEPVNSGIDEVLLFSGGVDSLGGAVQAAILQNRHVALVSHRSNSKIFSRQEKLVRELRARCRGNPPIHVPVWVHQRGSSGREHTQRSRTFLYAALAATVARVFGLSRIRFYENGVVGLNLPISEQAVGARATRTTHPQV